MGWALRRASSRTRRGPTRRGPRSAGGEGGGGAGSGGTAVDERGGASGFMRLRNITGKSRILRKRNAAETRYECNNNTRNIRRLLLISIPVHPTTVKVRSLHFYFIF